jgi:hypothetical protein
VWKFSKEEVASIPHRRVIVVEPPGCTRQREKPKEEGGQPTGAATGGAIGAVTGGATGTAAGGATGAVTGCPQGTVYLSVFSSFFFSLARVLKSSELSLTYCPTWATFMRIAELHAIVQYWQPLSSTTTRRACVRAAVTGCNADRLDRGNKSSLCIFFQNDTVPQRAGAAVVNELCKNVNKMSSPSYYR